MAAAPQTTNDDLLKYLKDTLAPSIATDLGLVNQNVTTTNANVKTLENTTTQNYTPWIIGGAVLLVFLMLFKK